MPLHIALPFVNRMATMKLPPCFDPLEHAVDVCDSQVEFIFYSAKFSRVGEDPFAAGVIRIAEISHQRIIKLHDLRSRFDYCQRLVMQNLAQVLDERLAS